MRAVILSHIFIFLLSVIASAQQDSTMMLQLNEVKASKVLLRQITIEGNKKTRRSIILREMNIEEGDSLYLKELADIKELNRKRVFNLSIFNDVQIFTDTVSNEIIDWRIVVKEQWYLIPEFTFKLADRNFNVWWVEQNADIRRANIGVRLRNRNFRGNLEEVSAVAQIGYTQKFGLEYMRPYVDKEQKHGFGVKFFLSRNEEWYYGTDSNKWEFASTQGSYITNSFEIAGAYIFRPAYASRHLFEIRYMSQNVNDTFLLLNNDYFLNGSTQQKYAELLYRYDLNLVDNWNYPMEGFKTIFTSVLRVGIQGFNFQNYYQAEIGYFKKLSKKFYSSHILRGRISYPEKQPYTHVYAMGRGSEYLRGYEYYVIDGSHYGILRTNLKYELVNTKIRKIPIRYISTIIVRLYPKIFADVGYARNPFPGNSFLNNRPLYSGGFGLDIVSIYDFKLRVEYTWNHLGEKGLFLHINNSE